jgi:ureidoacrylate peracid hydrolase
MTSFWLEAAMNRYETPQWVRDRVLKRQGKLHSHDTIDAGRSALIVVDMQNYFVAEGFGAEVPPARGIVANINRLAGAMRAAGGTVAWVQTSASAALERWANHHRHQLTEERMRRRLTELNETHEGFKLYPALETLPQDLRIKKIVYSAFIAGSSDIDAQFKRRGIDTVLVTGTVTNVCCESSARDAMMLDYRVIMISDGNASQTDEEHAAALNNFHIYFGDVMTTDDAIAKLVPVARRSAG